MAKHRAQDNYEIARNRLRESVVGFPRIEFKPYVTPPEMLASLRRAAEIKVVPSKF